MVGIRFLIKLFENGNVMVTGVKGSGKDVMFGNVIARIKRPYISNCDFTNDDRFIPLDFNKLDVSENNYRNFIYGNVKKYVYPYDDGIHIYISDAGNYLPAQYNGQLDKEFPHLPVLFSLIRQLGDAQIHTNTQAYSRVWLKLREQASDHFIRCDKCKVLFGKLVIATYYYYDKASSCEERVKPCRIHVPFLANKEQIMQVKLYKDKFYNQYGTVKKKFYICWNRSKHDSRFFKEVLANGKENT